MNTKIISSIGNDKFLKIFNQNSPAYTYLYEHKYSYNNSTDNFIQNLNDDRIYKHFLQEYINGLKTLQKFGINKDIFGKVMFIDPQSCTSKQIAKRYSNAIILGFGKINIRKHDLSIFKKRELTNDDIEIEDEKLSSFKNCFYGIKITNYKDRIICYQKFIHRYYDSNISRYSNVVKKSNIFKIHPSFFIKNNVKFLSGKEVYDALYYKNQEMWNLFSSIYGDKKFFKELLTCRPSDEH